MKKSTSITLASAIVASTLAVSSFAASDYQKQYSEAELITMDTNKDSMVSKAEFLSYSELVFSKMKLTDGMIGLKSKAKSNTSTKSGENTSSMNSKPIGTTTGSPDVNERDAVNGKNY